MTKKEIKNGIIESIEDRIDALAGQVEHNYKILETACNQCKRFIVEPFVEFSKYPSLYARIAIDDTLRNSSYYKEFLERDIYSDKTMTLQKCFRGAEELRPLNLVGDLWGEQWSISKVYINIPIGKIGLDFDRTLIEL